MPPNDPFTAALDALDVALTGSTAPADTIREPAARSLLDAVIETELHLFWSAKLRLERRLSEVCRRTRGTVAGAEALRLAHAVAGLFGTPVARPLLNARTSGARRADAAMSAVLTARLERAGRTDPSGFSTVGD